MRIVALAGIAAGLMLSAAPGWAQQNPALDTGAAQPKAGHTLSPGANSFSEGQAHDLLKSRSFSDISPLVNGSDGIWRGTAMHGGKRVRVSVDYKGDVSEQPE